MNKVSKAVLSPHHCAVNPHLGSEPTKGLWDSGTELPGPGMRQHRVYVAVSTVEDLARRDGWISPEERDLLTQHIARLERDLEHAREDLVEQNRVLDAIDVFESAGFRARKKPGRKAQAA